MKRLRTFKDNIMDFKRTYILALLVIMLPSIWVQGQTAEEKKEKKEKRERLHKSHVSPYNFNWKVETGIAAASLAYFIGGGVMDITRKPLTAAQVSSLNSETVNDFDKGAIGNRSSNGAVASDILLGVSFVLPMSVLAVRGCREDALLIGLMWFEVASLTLGTTEYVKSLVLRPRPLVYDPTINLGEKTTRDSRMSFLSGHTAAVAAFSFFGAKVFSDYSDNNLHKALVWSGAATLPAVTGYLRYRSGKHFPTDIIAGYALGATIGFLVPFLHKRKLVKGMTLMPYTSGINKDMGVHMSYQF